MSDDQVGAALNKAKQAQAAAERDVRAFGTQEHNRFYMLHGTLTDAAVPTKAGETYASLKRTYARAKQIVFTLTANAADGEFIASWSRDGINYKNEKITGVKDPVSSKMTFEKAVAGPVIAASYTYKEGAADGSIFGGITSTESVVI